MTVDTQVWTRDPDRPGYMLKVRDRTVREVFDDLREAVGPDPDGGEEYFTASGVARGGSERAWPAGRLAVFAVNGSSEGDYVHVEVFDGDGGHEGVLLAKTFLGRDAAWAFARRLADLLGA